MMSSIGADLNKFNTELLLSTLSNTDSLVRNYKESCNENSQLKQNLQSISESSVRLTHMYQKEKGKCKQLTDENNRLNVKLKELQTDVEELKHKKLNEDTIHQQTIAELEECIRKTSENIPINDYIDVCKLVIVQGNLLQQHQLATVVQRKKCKQISDMLRKRGERIDDLKQSPAKRSITGESKKHHATIATMTELHASLPMRTQSVCDKIIMHRPSTATRSTCTSTFIKMIDASTNTDNDGNVNKWHIRNLFDDITSHPPLISPIKSVNLMSKTRQQQPPKTHRNQGTITHIKHVDKEIGYLRSLPVATNQLIHRKCNSIDSGFVSPVQTKEEYSDDDYQFGVERTSMESDLLEQLQKFGEKMLALIGRERISNDHRFYREEFMRYKINQLEIACRQNGISNDNEMNAFESDVEFNGLRSCASYPYVPAKSLVVASQTTGFLDNNYESNCITLTDTKQLNTTERAVDEVQCALKNVPSQNTQTTKKPKKPSVLSKKRQTKIKELFNTPKRIKLYKEVRLLL